MNIELIKAILHVLDPAVDAPILSEAILPPSEDALQYLPATQPSALPATRPRPARWRTIRPSCRSYGTSRMILKKRRLSLPETGSV